MNQNLQPGTHPDADQLSVFVEGAATAQERERMLAHLAECRECRDAVFLMQRPVETPVAVKEASPEWAWQRWLMPIGVTGALVACVLTVVLIYVRPQTEVPKSVGQIAEVQAPETRANGQTSTPSDNAALAARSGKAKTTSGRDSIAINAVRQEASGAAGAKPPIPESQQAAASAATRGMETVPRSNSAAAMADAVVAPEPDAPPEVNSRVIQELPLKGRNVVNPQAPAATAGAAQAATPKDGYQAQQGLSASRVEGLSGQDALSGVSGRVTDATGAAIPQATIALRDAAGTTRQTATGPDGSFELTGVSAGRYDLTVTAPGFARKQQSIDLKASQLAMLQPVLNVGAVTESVEVTAAASTLETESTLAGLSAGALPSRLPVAASVSLGNRVLTLDSAGSLFLSRNAGKNWKRVKPQWTGKPVRIYLSTAEATSAKPKGKDSGLNSAQNVFQLTTDSGAEWTSEDGTHWRQ